MVYGRNCIFGSAPGHHTQKIILSHLLLTPYFCPTICSLDATPNSSVETMPDVAAIKPEVGAGVALMAITALAVAACHGAFADAIEGALALVYQNNPALNSQRVAARASDEGVGIAHSGYRPQVGGHAQSGEHYLDSLSKPSSGFGLTAQVTSPENDGVREEKAALLQAAAMAYQDMLRDAELLQIQRSNVKVLEATLRQTRDRFTAGEATRTDLAQAESSLAAGRSQLHAAELQYVTSKARYARAVEELSAAANKETH
jgi:outer membrane protein